MYSSLAIGGQAIWRSGACRQRGPPCAGDGPPRIVRFDKGQRQRRKFSFPCRPVAGGPRRKQDRESNASNYFSDPGGLLKRLGSAAVRLLFVFVRCSSANDVTRTHVCFTAQAAFGMAASIALSPPAFASLALPPLAPVTPSRAEGYATVLLPDEQRTVEIFRDNTPSVVRP